MNKINLIFFSDNRYREKIYSVTNLRILSFEMYKFFILYAYLLIIQKISQFFFFRFFFEFNFDFYSFIKIFTYLLLIDICYYIISKSNPGIKALHELIINSIFTANLIRLISLFILFGMIYFCTCIFKSLMLRLDFEYVSKKYNLDDDDDYDEEYNKYNRYNYSDYILTISFSFILFFYMIQKMQIFDTWPTLNLGRINNFKNKLFIMLKNIIIISFPSFFIIYVFLVFFYRTIFVFDLSFNYTSLIVILTNIFFMCLNCINNFLCSPINYITNEINTYDKLIKKEINFMKEENFYICHHLQNIKDLYEYPRDIKFNMIMINFENLKYLQKKIIYFINAINSKYNSSYNKKNYYYYNPNDKIKYICSKIFGFFDYSSNKILQRETSILNLKFIIQILGNVLIFISDAKINKTNEEKYKDCKDFSYFFMEKLIDIDEILVNLLQNRGISENIRNEMQKLRYIIKHYFDVIRNRQYNNQFLILMPQKIQTIINGNKIY